MVGVVFIFLQNWRATIIPVIAIPVSLVGTFTILAIAGASINNLSLFGLVLAVGIVVDDAIVVVENVERNMALGMPPREAAHRTMTEVSTALIAIALTLCAVFVPTAFISGISGLFFKRRKALFDLVLETCGLRRLDSGAYPWRRTRRSRAPSNGPDAYFVAQFSAGYTTNMFGFDLRQGQPRSDPGPYL